MRKTTYNEIGKEYIIPSVDIYENDDEFVIKAEIPGVKKQDVSVIYENGYIELSGKVDCEWENEYEIIDREFMPGDYLRKFFVGDKIDSEKISVKLENGILIMKLGKSENVKPRKIEITS